MRDERDAPVVFVDADRQYAGDLNGRMRGRTPTGVDVALRDDQHDALSHGGAKFLGGQRLPSITR